MKKTVLILVLFIIGVFLLEAGETIQEKLEKFGEENGKLYIQPLVTAFGSNLNSGLFNTAKVLKPYRFGIMFNAQLAFFPKEAEIFAAVRPDLYVNVNGTDIPIYAEPTIESASVFGVKGGTFHLNRDELPQEVIDEFNDADLNMPNGAQNTTEIPFVPLVIPQVNFGLPYGNELMFRYLPPVELNEQMGSLSFWGLGLKHSIDQYLLGVIPIDLAAQIAYQQFKITDIMTVNAFAFNAQVSKKLAMFTFYGGLGYESTTLNAKYETTVTVLDANNNATTEEINIDFDIKGENDVRATIGFRYSILVLKLFADYSICKYPVANFGFGLSF